MATSGDMKEIHRLWRRHELAMQRAKILFGFLGFVALTWLTILVFEK